MDPLDHEMNADAGEGAEGVVIRAIPGKPWPEPPSGGTWSRNPDTGDLTLIEASGVKPSPEQREERRKQQREAALQAEAQRQAAAKKTNSKE